MPSGVLPQGMAPVPRFHVLWITPDLAAGLLGRRRRGTRRHAGAVRAYASAMRERRWVLNGIPIILSAEGALLDGLQRLLACVEAATGFETLLAEDAATPIVDPGPAPLHHPASLPPHPAGVASGAVAAAALSLPGAPATPPGAVSLEIEPIDPATAQRYLAQDSGLRRVSRARVAVLAGAMRAGHWVPDARPICLAGDGLLLKGQHRLHAVILSESTVSLPVLRGLSPAAGPTYDSRARRSSGAADSPDSFGDRALVAAMANLLWRHECRPAQLRQAKASPAQLRAVLAGHPRLLLLRGFARRMVEFGQPSAMGYAAYVMEREDAALARRFLQALETGAGLGPGHPILGLRATLLKLRIGKVAPAAQLATLLAGWARFRARPSAPSRTLPAIAEEPDRMRQSQVIVIAGRFVGAAITDSAGGYSFAAVDPRLQPLAGRRWADLAGLYAAVRLGLRDALVEPARQGPRPAGER